MPGAGRTVSHSHFSAAAWFLEGQCHETLLLPLLEGCAMKRLIWKKQYLE
ncbi:MAG: hypothetical protein ACTSRF_09680 [Candidatus Freyarchaeota archaeon]